MPKPHQPHYTRRDMVKTAAAVALAISGSDQSGVTQAAIASHQVQTFPDIASGDPERPDFHGPRVIGATPGRDFLFQVPHTGVAPLVISASGLPRGLRMTDTGLIRGKVQTTGIYAVRLTATNRAGSVNRRLRIVAGQHKLALTPPMGWNSWYVYGSANTGDRTMSAADAMVKSGLSAKGYAYINLDDGWQNGRTANGEIRPKDSFGDMKNVADYIHGRGLRFGIYSSPGPNTCAGYTGSLGHELQDAQSYARWGVDFLKYDWCYYKRVVPHPDLQQCIRPYRIMREALDKLDRDIVFSLCQYGVGMWHVWTWGGKPPVLGNMYRISVDIADSWSWMSSNGFDHDGPLFPFSGPGRWNDPDMLMVGYGGLGRNTSHWSWLTPHEQLTQVTLWCMLAAPLILSCQLEKLITMEKISKFTLDMLTNTEVLAVDQDELGVQAQCVDRQAGDIEVWARPLWDGTVAVALFNRGSKTQKGHIASWNMFDPVLPRDAIPLRGSQPVRDLWKRSSLGAMRNFSIQIPIHGAILLKIGTPNFADM